MKNLSNKELLRFSLSLFMISLICLLFFGFNIHTPGVILYLLASLIACCISLVMLIRRWAQMGTPFKIYSVFGIILFGLEVLYALAYLMSALSGRFRIP